MCFLTPTRMAIIEKAEVSVGEDVETHWSSHTLLVEYKMLHCFYHFGNGLHGSMVFVVWKTVQHFFKRLKYR